MVLPKLKPALKKSNYQKGFVEEIFGVLIIVLVIVIAGLFFMSNNASKDIQTFKETQSNSLSEEADGMMMTLYDTKLGVFDKSYAEILIDACLKGYNKSQVYYGRGSGAINVEELINPMFDSKFGENGWALEVTTKSGNMTYGRKLGKIYIYAYTVPVPNSNSDENVDKITMYLK